MSEQHTKDPVATPLADEFIELYRTTTTNPADRALIILIEQNKGAIEPLFDARDPEWIHKAFRQVDVCNSGKTDVLIWHLIHASQDFFDTLHFFWNKKLDRRDERRKGVLLVEVQQQRDELLAGMQDIGDFAHDRSTGPAIEDALREVSRMAYEWLTANVGADKTAGEQE